MSNNKKPFVNLENAREREQTRIMKEIQARGECPFCPENLPKYHKLPIIGQNAHWLVTKNQWAYENTSVHLLIIHRRHAERLADISAPAWEALGDLVAWAERFYKIRGGGFGMRFGDPAFNGGTVRHLHAQLLVVNIADKNDPTYRPIRFRVG